MNQEKIALKEQVRAYVLQSAYGTENEINESTLIFKDGFFDSMGFVMLISYLDENFNIKVTDSELIEENFESINAITDFIISKNN
jgi:acyl carrier protein